MSRSLRALLAVMAASAFLAAPAALAENKPSGAAKAQGKGAPAPQDKGWYVPDMDSDQSGMRVKGKGGPKTPAAKGSGQN